MQNFQVDIPACTDHKDLKCEMECTGVNFWQNRRVAGCGPAGPDSLPSGPVEFFIEWDQRTLVLCCVARKVPK